MSCGSRCRSDLVSVIAPLQGFLGLGRFSQACGQFAMLTGLGLGFENDGLSGLLWCNTVQTWLFHPHLWGFADYA
ncbi:MAG: hypothetical protein H6510_17285 [Acidobacteria bacterium]|nr:hypothetical protein [Acidobacteriota bacterium]